LFHFERILHHEAATTLKEFLGALGVSAVKIPLDSPLGRL
jgi:hypothetical protein